MTFKREGISVFLPVCIAVVSVMMVFGLCSLSEAANATTSGVVSAQAFDETSILVRMPYTGDDNGDNTCTVEFKPCTEGTYTVWITNAPHTSSPYKTTITGLQPNSCYDIKTTFNDADNLSGAVTQTTRITSTWDNTLLHNINRFPSSGKWTAEGGWGLPGTKYGNIVCETCHTRNAPNIKRISGNISAPETADQFPGQTGGLGINFNSMTTQDGFGDDTGGHTESRKICEYCHSQTAYHRYNTAAQSYLTHNNNADCLGCHPHAVGFYYATGACDSCHGNPPITSSVGGPEGLASVPQTGSETPGAHSAHTAKSVACISCHYNSAGTGGTHRDSSVTLGFYAFDGGYQGGAYDGQTAVSSYNASTTTPATTVSKTGAKTCSNIYCHGATMAPNGGTNTTPQWDLSSTGACGACHGATSANPPTRGNHTKHAGSANGGRALSCTVCHYNYASTHVNNEANVAFDTETYTWLSGASYSGDTTMLNAYGSCTNIYCHSNANPAPNSDPAKNEPNEYKIVTWGQTGPFACDSCHRGKLTDTLTMRSNGHDRLVGKDWIRKYPCEYCHAATVDGGGNIIEPTRHGNNVKDVLMSSQWAIVGRGAPSYNAGTKVCSNVYCHSDGTTDPEQVRPFGWTENGTHCNTCHGHPRESCSSTGCHDGRIDVNGRDWPIKTGWPSGEEWKEAMPMFPNEGAGTARANSHPRHLQTNFPCDKCHYATIKNGTCTVCHTAGIPPGSMSEVAHIDPAFHVNKEKDVVFKEGGTFNATTKACSNTACHTGGTDPQWGGSINTSIICLNCHGTTLADVDDFEAFNGTQAKISLSDWATT
ncbi:MAG: CxxxxCH/CxxCH domain-containing protein, partial [Thermodesulfovibrionales bacterium]